MEYRMSMRPGFAIIIDREREKISAEYEADREGLTRRLGLPAITHFQQHYPNQLGNLVARTAVRATVWELVRAAFRAFR